MSGTFQASNTPWMKTAMREFKATYGHENEDIEDALPDGVTVSIYCLGNPRPLGAYITGLGEPIRIEPQFLSVGAVGWAAVRLIKEWLVTA